jgi:hypothetical protein
MLCFLVTSRRLRANHFGDPSRIAPIFTAPLTGGQQREAIRHPAVVSEAVIAACCFEQFSSYGIVVFSSKPQ